MTFLKLVRKLKKESNQLKIVCVGPDNAGKTTILKNVFENDITNISPTFGYSLYKSVYNELTLLIYDIGGQSIFRDYWNNFFEKCDGLIYVYDLTSEDDKQINKIINEVLNIPVLILGNKSDIIEVNKECVEYTSNIRLYYVCGIDNKTLKEPFDWFLTACRKVSIIY